jgi:hypothetical protein
MKFGIFILESYFLNSSDLTQSPGASSYFHQSQPLTDMRVAALAASVGEV